MLENKWSVITGNIKYCFTCYYMIRDASWKNTHFYNFSSILKNTPQAWTNARVAGQKILSMHIKMYPRGGTHNAAFLPVLPRSFKPSRAGVEPADEFSLFYKTQDGQIWCLKEEPPITLSLGIILLSMLSTQKNYYVLLKQ